MIEGEDFYYNQDGFIVLTKKYHLNKGFCCGNGCMHCPYDFVNVPEPKKTYLRKRKITSTENDSLDD
jgi:hypothetical protein